MLHTVAKISNPERLGLISLFSKFRPISVLQRLSPQFAKTNSNNTKLQLANTDFYGCEAEEKGFFPKSLEEYDFFNSQIDYTWVTFE